MRGPIALCLFALAACTDRPDTYIVPLAELDAELVVGPDSRILSEPYTFRLVAGKDPCLVLSPRNTRATLDGLDGEIDMGYPEYSNRDCYGPAISWRSVSRGPSYSSFVLTDGSATWEMQIWQPFDFGGVNLVTPLPVHAGDTVTFRVSTRGTLTNAKVTMTANSSIISYDESNGVTRNGLDVTFKLPMVLPPGSQTIRIGGDHEPLIDKCIGPSRCSGADYVSELIQVEISP